MIAKLGFTGTQGGMTDRQIVVVAKFLADYAIKEAHHGDCIGSDDQFGHICRAFRLFVVIHPPDNQTKRAWTGTWNEKRTPKPYLERNHDIVRECDCLLATPKSDEEELRSGTWATVRYARKLCRPIIIVRPSGEVVMENWPWGDIAQREMK